MFKSALSLLFLAAVALAWWVERPKEAAACTEPTAYSIGIFDRRFVLSQKDFLSALAEAEMVWESPSGRELFTYSPEGELSINLVYDYRQEVTEELTELESEVKEDEADYRAMEANYARLKSEYEIFKNYYESRVAALEARNAAYEARVEAWDRGPRNSREEFEALEKERVAINKEVEALRLVEQELNEKVGELNSVVDRLNRLARSLNLNVEEYNIVGASRGETFEGGIYYKDARGEGIDIYEFQSREKLVRILAHELGHALGLEHIEDPEAIMYRLNEGEAGKATEADLTALEVLCAS